MELVKNATGAKSQAESNTDGVYFVGSVSPGDYSISVKAAGFDQTTIDLVHVEVEPR